ncbi:cardiolipin synthase [Alkaliphilus transvaalensis]|uniref:cardiolipin synthase n=1 Tax=Alkaliphilus transvaalensis TaxID=114628 RepID=UPI0006847A0D|nr:cardiolipin synthase [Alkaliphilus transvaalensis]
MITFYTITTLILFFLIMAFNLFILIPHGFWLGIYPYIGGITAIFALILLLIRLIEVPLSIKIFKGLLILLTIFIFFTFIQIWRNTRLINQYQEQRSKYMDELMKITTQKNENKYPMGRMEEGIVNLIEANTGIPVTQYNTGTLMNGGKMTIDAMIEDIAKAQEHIHILFFIIREDAIGNKFKDTLIKKAKEGVEVRVIYDGLGSRGLSNKYLKELREAGAEMIGHDGYINSILKGKLNHRNHRKIIIVDGKIGYVGGLNIGDEYLGRDKNIGNWKDLQIRIEGEAVNWMQKIFLGDWYYVSGKRLLDAKYFPRHNETNLMPVQLITSGFDTHWNEISQLYFSMITSAQDKLYIGTPYLVLNDSMVKALQTAALRGVDVRIIIPKKPDFFIVGWANESFFEILLKANVKIYQYDAGFLHAKVFLVDDRIVSVGSANFNTRSLFLDYEINAVVYDEKIVKEMNQEFQVYLERSIEITYEDEVNKSKLQKFKQLLGKLIIPLS